MWCKIWKVLYNWLCPPSCTSVNARHLAGFSWLAQAKLSQLRSSQVIEQLYTLHRVEKAQPKSAEPSSKTPANSGLRNRHLFWHWCDGVVCYSALLWQQITEKHCWDRGCLRRGKVLTKKETGDRNQALTYFQLLPKANTDCHHVQLLNI